MLKTGHLSFNTAALVMNRYKNRAETGLQNLDNRAILCKVRGHWRSWERVRFACERSWVRIPYAPR